MDHIEKALRAWGLLLLSLIGYAITLLLFGVMAYILILFLNTTLNDIANALIKIAMDWFENHKIIGWTILAAGLFGGYVAFCQYCVQLLQTTEREEYENEDF